jgi:formylmethanofuran dehydrogenase subunit B
VGRGVSGERTFTSVACLGCGCGCDDLTVRVRDGRIVDVSPACPVSRAWFGDGSVPAAVQVEGRSATIERAIEVAARLLLGAARPLVLIAPDLSTQAQRSAVAVADLLRAEVDGATSDSAAAGVLAGQRRGRASATLGEVKNRADVILFWAVDPRERYPRFLDRYATADSATHARTRAIISVSIGQDRGPARADLAAEFAAEDEMDALSVVMAAVRGRPPAELPERLRPALAVAERLRGARYAVIVHDAESASAAGSGRVEGLATLTQLLNESARAAHCALRAGGNRSGAEAALTWQTGYPMRVSFRDGHPRYRPERSGVERLRRGEVDAALIAGSAGALGELGPVASVVIGPRASTVTGARVAIDTGIAGIHEPGTGYRMDDVPIPLSAVLEGPRSAEHTLRLLLAGLRQQGGSAR